MDHPSPLPAPPLPTSPLPPTPPPLLPPRPPPAQFFLGACIGSTFLSMMALEFSVIRYVNNYN